MNLHIEINQEFYTIEQLVAEFKEASKDRRLMSYELENNEETIKTLKLENSRLNNVSNNLEIEKQEFEQNCFSMSYELENNEETIKTLKLEKIEVESQLAYAQDYILELEETLAKIQELTNLVL